MNMAFATWYSSNMAPAVTSGAPAPRPMNYIARVFALSRLTSPATPSTLTNISANCM